MKRSTALKVINPILAVLVISQLLSGIFGHSLPYKAFEVLHRGGGYVLAVVIVLHLILNWNWVKATYFKRPAPVAS
ncbi:MAG: DUF4405 domain-containing protein [Kiritimatiellales bacterium]|nr:DUF4405 domain-containing protein [Kiritimatiellota bacterium]MBL7011794.1 DUF4405 domain-containing protein [Kiritimatiellales bacterium]